MNSSNIINNNDDPSANLRMIKNFEKYYFPA